MEPDFGGEPPFQRLDQWVHPSILPLLVRTASGKEGSRHIKPEVNMRTRYAGPLKLGQMWSVMMTNWMTPDLLFGGWGVRGTRKTNALAVNSHSKHQNVSWYSLIFLNYSVTLKWVTETNTNVQRIHITIILHTYYNKCKDMVSRQNT